MVNRAVNASEHDCDIAMWCLRLHLTRACSTTASRARSWRFQRLLMRRARGGHACQAFIFACSRSFGHTEVTVPNRSFEPLRQHVSGSVSRVLAVPHAALFIVSRHIMPYVVVVV